MRRPVRVSALNATIESHFTCRASQVRRLVANGQCIATALQFDRRCPLCRMCPEATSNNDEPFEEGFNDAVSASVVRIMSKIPTRLIRQLLRIFDVRLNSYTPRMLATALSEQLHYETDSDFEEEA